ncbi:SART-1 protein [Blastocladiella britannica]|nr:SART-1 protein [Blastocladiella britannica]
MDILERDGAQAQVEISLSVDDTNALRAKLGLPPLRVEPSAANVEAAANFAAHATDTKKKAASDALAARVTRARNLAALRTRLAGPTLGDADPAAADGGVADGGAGSWAKRQRRRATDMLAAQYEMDEADVASSSAAAPDYSSKDLAGLAVAHDLDECMTEGAEMVLTLKDKGVLDEDADDVELENVTLRDAERTRRAIDARSRKAYSGYDDAQADEQLTLGGGGASAAAATPGGKLLRQYDDYLEETEGKPTSAKPRFVLGQEGAGIIRQSGAAAAAASPEELLRAKAMSLEYEKQKEVDSFKSAEEVKVKKIKKKKRSIKARTADDASNGNDDGDDAMLVDDAVTRRAQPLDVPASVSFVDDDELQAVVAAARRNAVRRATRAPPPSAEEFDREFSMQAAAAGDDSDAADEGNGEIIMDATSEFVRGLGRDGVVGTVKPEPGSVVDLSALPTMANGDDDDDDDDDDAMDMDVDEEEVGDKDHPPEVKKEQGDEYLNPIQDEPEINRGLGSALALFKKRGAIEALDEEAQAREKQLRARQAWEVEHGAGGREMSKAARKRRAEEMTDRLKDYKPNVNIEYYDAQGRKLSTKDAYKEQSHHFHGKHSGKNKLEKIMRKEEEQRRQLNMASGDRTVEIAAAMESAQRARGSAGLVLTEGNIPVAAAPRIQSTSMPPPNKRQKKKK